MSDAWQRRALASMLAAGERFGAGGADPAERILVEFVSANPTGPLVAASGRHAAYGDALARILEHHGHEVSREYYFNDAGGQIRLLGESVLARARGEEVPEGGYQGDYVADLAAADRGRGCTGRGGSGGAGGRADAAEHSGDAHSLRRAVRPVLQRAHPARGVAHRARAGAGDARRGAVTRTATRAPSGCARRRSATTRIAWWCGPTASRPTWRATSPTCRTSASAAIERQLMPVGSDHHAYVRELKAAMAALGGDPNTRRGAR